MKKKVSPIVILLSIFVLAFLGFSIRFLSALDKETLKETLISHAKSETGLDLAVKGDLILTYFPLGLELNDVELMRHLDQAQNQHQLPAFLKVSKMKAEFNLFSFLIGKIVVDDLVLQDGALSLVILKNGDRNWDIEPAVFQTSKSDVFDLAIQNITIQNLVFSIEDQQNNVLKKIGISNAEMAAYDGDAFTLSLVGSFEGAPLFVDYQGPYPQHYFTEKAKAESLLLKVRYAGTTFEANGKVGPLFNRDDSFPVLDLKAILLGGKLSVLNSLLMTDLPDLGPYELNFEIESDPDLVQIDKMTLKLKQSEVAGSIDFFLKNHPRYDANIKIKSLNVSDFISADTEKKETSVRKLLSYFDKMDGEADIAIKNIGSTPGMIENIYATLEQKNHSMSLSHLKGKAFGGDVTGTVSLNFLKEPSLAWDLSVKNAKVGIILKDESIQSLAQIDMKATSKITDLDSFINKMKGALVVKAEPGTNSKLDLDVLRSEILLLLFPREVQQQKAGAK